MLQNLSSAAVVIGALRVKQKVLFVFLNLNIVRSKISRKAVVASSCKNCTQMSANKNILTGFKNATLG